MNKEIKEYTDNIINTIIESEELETPDVLLDHLQEYILEECEQKYNNYILGKEETFILTDTEFEQLYKKASLKYIGDILDNLVDKDVVKTSVNENGDILYSLTEQGKHMVEYLNEN